MHQIRYFSFLTFVIQSNLIKPATAMQSQNKNCVHIGYVNIKHVSRIDSDFIDERRVLNENSRK